MNAVQRSLDHRTADLDIVEQKNDIRSSMSPFFAIRRNILYPKSVVNALQELVREYNEAFIPLVRANVEGSLDYQYCMSHGKPVNWAVQIDMCGLTDEFLSKAPNIDPKKLKSILRRSIFEIENSLAMYQFLERIFITENYTPHFGRHFRKMLDRLRSDFGKPIALLAVTQEKLAAMREAEFGKLPGEPLSDEEVRELSGFDRLFGPDDFAEYIRTNGSCAYLLYARTSDPVQKLKDPRHPVKHTLLNDEKMRVLIRQHSVTLSIDDPAWPSSDDRRIADTKRYQAPMNMAFEFNDETELYSNELALHLGQGKSYDEFSGEHLSAAFSKYLQFAGVEPAEVCAGSRALRCKPAQGAYGCYGHVSGFVSEGEFRSQLRRNIKKRGRYVVQPEIPTQVVTNLAEGRQYSYIDRNFFVHVDGSLEFIGGFRAMIPSDSSEAKSNRIHGNRHSVWAEIKS